jgi:glyoxylase-like metal-dependent hydrolase (beta-lactamase superfamily II)
MPSGLHFIQAPSDRFPASANMVCATSQQGLTLIDTGGSGAENHRTTTEVLAALGHAPRDVTRVLLTHAHADHSGGLSLLGPHVHVSLHAEGHAMAKTREAFFTTFDFELIRERYPDPENPGRQRAESLEQYLAEGDCPFQPFTPAAALPPSVELAGVTLHAVPGSGHAPGHVMFHAPELKLLIAGDLVGHQLAWHSPHGGGAAGYLDSLERAHALDVQTVWPAHGPPIEDGRAQVEKLRDKLLKREDKLLGALRSGTRTFHELILVMIGAASDDDIALFPAVPMLEGHLMRLEGRGAVHREGGPAATDLRISHVARTGV